VGASGLVVEYGTRNFHLAGSNLTWLVLLRATFSKLLTYCVLRPTQLSTLSGTGNELLGYGEKAWCWLHDGFSCLLEQAVDWMVSYYAALSLVSCQSAATFEIVKHCWSLVTSL